MLFIAWKNITRSRGRFLLSVSGVAFSVTLILLVSALYQGWNARMSAYIESVDADLWVAQPGSGDMAHSVSLMPKSTTGAVGRIEGVRSASPFVGRRLALRFGEREPNIFLVGFDKNSGDRGPVKMLEGRNNPVGKEIIVDRSMAQKQKLNIGDTIELEPGNDWKIIGISTGGNQVLSTFAFANVDDAKALFRTQDFVNYVLVRLDPGENSDIVANRLESALPVKVFTRAEFIAENRKVIRDSFLPIIAILVVIAFIIGSLIVGLMMYTATLEKVGEYGVLKAIGFSSNGLRQIVAAQAMGATVFGFASGAVIAFVLARMVGEFEPSFVTQFRAADVVIAFALTVLMGLTATWLPVRRVMRIDPAETFRA